LLRKHGLGDDQLADKIHEPIQLLEVDANRLPAGDRLRGGRSRKSSGCWRGIGLCRYRLRGWRRI
jgi:hypothetical protein